MGDTATLLSSVPADRERFAPRKLPSSWGSTSERSPPCGTRTGRPVAVCFLLHWVSGGLGICVGYHRLLTHRSFRCPRALEYALALFGSLSPARGTDRMGHPSSPASSVSGPRGRSPQRSPEFLVESRAVDILETVPQKPGQKLNERYVPDLLRVPFYGLPGADVSLAGTLTGVAAVRPGRMAFRGVGGVRALGVDLSLHLLSEFSQPRIRIPEFLHQ